jgi:hypothetical protein
MTSSAAHWPPAARIAAAVVLVGAFAAQLANRALTDMSDGYASLFREIVEEPVRADTAAVLGLVAPPLLLGMVLILTGLTRRRAPVSSWAALVCGVIAFTFFPVMTGHSSAAFSLVRAGVDSATVAKALEQPGGPGGMVLVAVFSLTSLACVLSLAWALWRSHVVYRASAALLALFMIADVSGVLPVDAHWLGLAAMVLAAISLFTAGTPAEVDGTTIGP